MPPATSSTQLLAEELLGVDLRDWILTRRHELGPVTRSWSLIAAELKHATGGKVDVSREMVRRWALPPGEHEGPTAA